MSRFSRANFGAGVRRAAVAFTGGGSGLYEPTQLSPQQRDRSIVLQDTRRTVDQITWRKLLAYARQLHANCGEVRGPVMEKATLANSGGWMPRHVGKNTPKDVRNKYEEWLWEWMKVCDVRGQPYDFLTDMYLASIMLDRDGEAPLIFTEEAGQPRLQWVANHRMYSHWNIFTVTEPGPYQGMKFNNGVVYNDRSAPVAYYILDESLQFAQAIQGNFIPTRSMMVMYNPDWCDQGRGVTAYAHGIRRIFDMDDIHGYLLIGIKNDSMMPIISETIGGALNPGKDYLKTGTGNSGSPIVLEEMQGGLVLHVRSGDKTKVTSPSSTRPDSNIPEYLESILVGVYQGINWPYEYTRLSKEARGANIRVTVEKINHSVRTQFRTLKKIATRSAGYALGYAVNRGELPHGEWWAWEWPMPPEMTADKYHEHQEDRENYKIGINTIQGIAAKYGQHWQDDIREQRDEDLDDLLTRCENLHKKHGDLELREVIDLYQQRSANPGLREGLESSPESAGSDGDAPAKKPAKKKGK